MQQKLSFIDERHSKISVRQQSLLLGLNRSNVYYKYHPKLNASDTDLMNLIRDIWIKHPASGYRTITQILKNMGYTDNKKRILRLMKKMGIQAIYPKPKTSISNKQHKKFPYLLKDYNLTSPNQVFVSDITYLKLSKGFIYLIAILDLYSRYIISWNLSDKMDASFCVVALKRALKVSVPEICNTDQGSQFSSEDWINTLDKYGVKPSMDGKGSFYDNIFIERLWRTIKYEDFYLQGYESLQEVFNGLDRYIEYYNNIRPHQGIAYKTPAELYNFS